MRTIFTKKAPGRIRQGTSAPGRLFESRFCALWLVLLLSTVSAFAQSKVTGRVIDAQGSALPGVSILVRGTTTGTVTTAEGDYTLNVARGNETLVFSYIGYLSQEVPINGRSSINITLASDDKMLS